MAFTLTHIHRHRHSPVSGLLKGVDVAHAHRHREPRALGHLRGRLRGTGLGSHLNNLLAKLVKVR